MSRPPFLTKLTLRNFRSIREETVEFANPLVLVGKNGSGKSNFVDALAFLADCIDRPLQGAVDKRGGFGEVCHRRPVGDREVFLQADFVLAELGETASYAMAFTDHDELGTVVTLEHSTVSVDGADVWFDRKAGNFQSNIGGLPVRPDPRGLLLPIFSGVTAFADVIQALAGIRVYKFDPNTIRALPNPDSGRSLKTDGSNLGSILQRIIRQDATLEQRISELLAASTPGISIIRPQLVGERDLLLFKQDLGRGPVEPFFAQSMSDGTLTTLALIVATMQDPPPPLFAIEEPERYGHPGTLDFVSDTIETATRRSQIVITTHSPELLDAKWLQPENFRVVEWEKGGSRISLLGKVPVKALQKHLMGAGELLLANALDPAHRSRVAPLSVYESNTA